MQRWQDELIKHPIHTTLKQFIDVLEAEIEIDDPILTTEKARFSKFTRLLSDTLHSLEPDLAPIDLLNQVQNQLNSHGAINTAQALSQSRDPNQFRSLNDQINPSLSYITQLRAAAIGKDTKKSDTEAATVGMESLARNISKKRTEYENAVDKAVAKIEDAERQIAVLRTNTEAAKQTFDESLTTWSATANATIEENKTRLSEGLTEFQNKSREQLEKFFKSQDDEANKKQEDLSSRLRAIIDDSQIKHKEILELYKLVARDSITGGHKQIADREYIAAQTWRRATIGSIIATALWIGYSLFFMEHVVEPEIVFWLQIGKSVSLTALFISFAVYASTQAALHRVNERKARSFFLQVQAFDPFIESLPDEKRIELKQALTARIFGSDESEHEKAMLENGGFKTIDRAFDIIEKAKKLIRQ